MYVLLYQLSYIKFGEVNSVEYMLVRFFNSRKVGYIFKPLP